MIFYHLGDCCKSDFFSGASTISWNFFQFCRFEYNSNITSPFQIMFEFCEIIFGATELKKFSTYIENIKSFNLKPNKNSQRLKPETILKPKLLRNFKRIKQKTLKFRGRNIRQTVEVFFKEPKLKQFQLN